MQTTSQLFHRILLKKFSSYQDLDFGQTKIPLTIKKSICSTLMLTVVPKLTIHLST